ncbi:cell division protein FtsQ/DivIB [Microlunatus soli]|uniref:Cell division protein FtsQ n=1 Tax=Microlunatus soli TaxID=630515 RepID=A0A1H1PF73_9ACTN|nr:FtsQ-type POTRA domain-containing protein [Microlunatus soli]SDS09784.1 cell division protein FtsQ [Microlunatus soli]
MTITREDLRIRHDDDPDQIERRARRRRLLLAVLVPLLILVLIAAAIWVVGFSSLLAVSRVQVKGAKQLDESAVVEVAAVPKGAPLARLDVDAVQQRVAGIGELESARVSRDWPHTVRIDVVERTPAYAVKQGNGYLLVDRHGVGYQTVTSPADELPRATANSSQPQLLKALATVVAALPNSLQRKIETIQAPTRDSIQLKLKNGDVVFWGSEDQSALKAEVVAPLLKQPGTHFDVSAPGNPAIR